MKVYQGIILGFVQGLTEFLPVSSSGHIILTEKLLGVNGGLFFSLLLHAGTLFAVAITKSNVIRRMNGKFAARLIIATVPAGIVGVFLGDFVDKAFFGGKFLWLGFLITAAYLFVAETKYKPKKTLVTTKDAVWLGFSQAVAVVPAISRSGAVFSTGLLLGIDKKTLSDFTFLMSIPVILGGIAYELVKGFFNGGWGNIAVMPTLFGGIAAFVSGTLAVYFVEKVYINGKTRWFSVYLCALSLILLMV